MIAYVPDLVSDPLPVTNRDTRHIIQVVRKLGIATPSTELVDAYLSEIAKAYSVNWSSPSKPGDDDGDDKPDGGIKVSPSLGLKPDLFTYSNIKY